MDEAAIAKALEGKFFWEGTTKYDPDMSRDCIAIRRAQSKFVPKDAAYEPPEGWWKRKLPPSGTNERIREFRGAVAMVFGVDEEKLSKRATRTEVAKSFYMWGLCRYFPEVSIAQIGRMIERNHSTVIHGRDEFKQVEHLYTDLIEKMDRVMNYQPG